MYLCKEREIMNKKFVMISLGLMLAGMVLWVGGCDDEGVKSCGSDCTKACCAAKEAASGCCATDAATCCGDKTAEKAGEEATCCGDAPSTCCGSAAAEKLDEGAKVCPSDCAKPCCTKS